MMFSNDVPNTNVLPGLVHIMVMIDALIHIGVLDGISRDGMRLNVSITVFFMMATILMVNTPWLQYSMFSMMWILMAVVFHMIACFSIYVLDGVFFTMAHTVRIMLISTVPTWWHIDGAYRYFDAVHIDKPASLAMQTPSTSLHIMISF